MQNLLFTCLWYFLCVTAVSQREIWFLRSFTTNRRRIWGFRRRWWMGRGRRYMSASPLQFFSMPKRSNTPTLHQCTNAPPTLQHSKNAPALSLQKPTNAPPMLHCSNSEHSKAPKCSNAQKTQVMAKARLSSGIGEPHSDLSAWLVLRPGENRFQPNRIESLATLLGRIRVQILSPQILTQLMSHVCVYLD